MVLFFFRAVKRVQTQLKPPELPVFRNPPVAPGGAIMAARSVGSLVVVALSACSGTLDGSDKIDVALLRSRRDDNAAKETKILIDRTVFSCQVSSLY